MSKNTPGPWRWMAVNGNPDALMVVAGAIGECGICHVINRPAGTKDQPTTEHPHNARLIAAAPELLQALWDCITQEGTVARKDADPQKLVRRLNAIDDICREAIAKAE